MHGNAFEACKLNISSSTYGIIRWRRAHETLEATGGGWGEERGRRAARPEDNCGQGVFSGVVKCKDSAPVDASQGWGGL